MHSCSAAAQSPNRASHLPSESAISTPNTHLYILEHTKSNYINRSVGSRAALFFTKHGTLLCWSLLRQSEHELNALDSLRRVHRRLSTVQHETALLLQDIWKTRIKPVCCANPKTHVIWIVENDFRNVSRQHLHSVEHRDLRTTYYIYSFASCFARICNVVILKWVL